MLIYDQKGPYTIFERVALAIIVLIIGYEMVNVFVPNGEMLKYLRVLGVSVYAVALWIFAPDCWAGMFQRPPRPRDFVICAIWLKFFGDWLFSVYATVFRVANEPAWMLNNELLPFILIIGIVAVYLHISNPGQNGEGVPRRTRYAVAYGIGATLLLFGVVATSSPHIAPFVNRACPYLGDWFGTDAGNLCKLTAAPGRAHG